VCCSVLQCVGVFWSVLQCVAVCCSVLQYVAVCCSVFHDNKEAITFKDFYLVLRGKRVLQLVAVCCIVFWCIAV